MASSTVSSAAVPVDLERRAAWKYVGYPGFSQFMASSNNCFAIRRFDALNVRILLYLQNDIVIKERALQELDEISKGPQEDGLETGCGSFLLDADTPRQQLLDNLADLMKEYNERVVTYVQMQDRPYASEDQRHNLGSWLKYYQNAIESSEQSFISERDLICSRVPRRTHFGRWMQRLGASRLALMGSTGQGATKYYDWNVWKSFGGFWLVFSTIGVLLGPLWAMPFARNTAQRLAIVSCATVAFSFLATFGTTWKPSQRSMLIAGYCGLTILMLGLTPGWHDHIGDTSHSHTVGNSMPSPTAISTISPSPTRTTRETLQTSTQAHPTSTEMSGPTPSGSKPSHSALLYDGRGISTASIAGIVVGLTGGLLVTVLAAYLVYRRRRRRSKIHELGRSESQRSTSNVLYPTTAWLYDPGMMSAKPSVSRSSFSFNFSTPEDLSPARPRPYAELP